MSKVSNDHMRKCIADVLAGAEEKKREFMETVELQIGLKNYDPQKDKRFAGNIKLPHIPRPKMRVCVLGDAYHCEKAAAMGIDFKNAEGLKNFNKNKKLIKKFGAPPPVAAPLSLPCPSPPFAPFSLPSSASAASAPVAAALCGGRLAPAGVGERRTLPLSRAYVPLAALLTHASVVRPPQPRSTTTSSRPSR